MPLFKAASTTEPPWTLVAPITVMIGDMTFSFTKDCYKELVLYELLANGCLRNASNGLVTVVVFGCRKSSCASRPVP
jgi:hypothetical protein